MTRTFNDLADSEIDELEVRFQAHTTVIELAETSSAEARTVSVTDLVRYAKDIRYDVDGAIARSISIDPWMARNWNDILQSLDASFCRLAAAAADDDVIVLHDDSTNETVELRHSLSEPDLYVLIVTLSETRSSIPTRLSVATTDRRTDIPLPDMYRNQYQIDLEADDPIVALLKDDRAQVVIW